MAIQEANIVFVESQVMDDVPEGGGAATGNVIVDGQMNNVFEDISDLDRAYGRFNLRKIFLAVRTLSTDLFGGAKSVITQLPEDPAISYALFSTADPFDTRSSAANRVAAYLYKGPMWPGWLHENHISGMQAIKVLQRVNSALPPIGKTLTLVQFEGEPGEIEQYVRVTSVDVVERTFVDGLGEFVLWEVTLGLSDALRHDFAGHPAERSDASYSYAARARIRDTTVADATRYYGGVPLVSAAGVGDRTLAAQSMFAALVPSAQTEIPLANQALAPELTVTMSAGARDVEVAQQAHTLALAVTAENRRLNWIETLYPIPAPGAFSLAYMSQGNWYSLQDDGTGNIQGTDPGFGAGTLNYVTGSMSVTLGALPDAGSQIMLTWATPVHYTVRAGATSDAAAALVLDYTLASAPIVPGSLVVSYPVGGTTRTATDAAEDGTVSGTGVSGRIDYATGAVTLEFTAPPDRAANLSNAYTKRTGTGLLSGDSATITGGSFTVPGQAPFRNGGTMQFDLAGTSQDCYGYITSGGQVRVKRNRERRTSSYAGYLHWTDQVVGSFDASTGVVTLSSGVGVTTSVYERHTGGWSVTYTEYPIVSVSGIAVERDTAAWTPDNITAETVEPATVGLRLNLTTTVGDPVVANSLRFSLTGKTYEDRAGTLYTDIDPNTQSGTPAGSIDYENGECSLTFWEDNQPAAISVSACLTRYGQWTAIDASLRASAAPLAVESLSVTATTINGDQISGQSDQNGDINGTYMRGAVNYDFGTAAVEFGQDVGGTWTPTVVDPTTIRYNAVAYSYLPLDANILGIDPVRLPADGRVPIFRPGDIVMVMHTAETAPATVANSDTIDCGRTRIGWVRVLDGNGDSVVDGYELDRALGIVTFTDVSGIVQPVTVRHTVADLRQLTDVQITGALTLARPLTHIFPAGETVVASCLIHGDRRARVSLTFDQQTWDGTTWQDNVDGSEATASLDLIAHPITVTNEGAETERWVLRWTSTTNVELIGERRGLVFSGAFNADIAPINPRTRDENGQNGVPYLTIPVAANGGGWSAGNIVRINTVGAIADIWMARAIQQSDEPMDDGADGCELYALGNIDRP